MTLPARQQRALDQIGSSLRESESSLAVMFATFGRLAQGEDMPERERIHSFGVRLSRRAQRIPVGVRAILAIPVALAAAVTALLLGGGHGSTKCKPVPVTTVYARPAPQAGCAPVTAQFPLGR